MTKMYSFFDGQGVFLAQVKTLNVVQLADNTPAGFTAIEGVYDSACQRVDMTSGEVVDFKPDAPADTEMETYSWDDQTKRWVSTPTLLAVKQQASSAIDSAAGAARLRYITDVPGQQAVYLQKASEAASFKAAGYQGDMPPYIAAEASATGMTGQAAADRILAIAAAWGNDLSPAIERIRISTKQSIEEAQSPSAVTDARNTGLSAFAEI